MPAPGGNLFGAPPTTPPKIATNDKPKDQTSGLGSFGALANAKTNSAGGGMFGANIDKKEDAK